ncbi:MAG: MFS transporter, partial [Bacteroidales bacterium]
GIVIPLSTGLISLFFAGKDRTKQFGLNSAISNLTVVMATFFTGYLAGISWRLPFIVYLLPFIAILLAVPLKKNWPALNNNEDESMINESGIIIGKRGLDIKNLGNIMALYFTVTFSVVIFIFYVPFVISANGLSDKLAGI